MAKQPQHKRQTSKPAKVFDVLRPGKAPAHATSRPVVGNRQTVRDLDFSERPLMDAKQKVALTPSRAAKAKEAGTMSLAPSQQAEPAELQGEDIAQKDLVSSNVVVANEQTKADVHTQAEPAVNKPSVPLREAVSVDTSVGYSKGSQPPQAIEGEKATVGTDAEQPETTQDDQNTSQAQIHNGLAGDSKFEGQGPRKTHVLYTSEGSTSEPLHMGMPADLSGKVIVSHHKKHTSTVLVFLAFVGILVLLIAILNVLLDADIIQTDLDLPHTNYFDGR